MERFLIDIALFGAGLAVGYAIGNQINKVNKVAEPVASGETAGSAEPAVLAEPVVSTEATEPAKKKKKKRVVLTPSVA